MTGRRSLVIDTDTASDDAVALVLTAAADVDIAAVTVVAGNVPLDLAVRNAIVTLDLCDAAHVPVHAGADGPLARPLETAQETHGDDGMGGAALPEPSRSATPGDAVDVLLELATASPGRHTLVTLGPMTNVARAIQRDIDFLTRFDHTFMMAGSPDGIGNVNVAGEYNVWADPEAAAIVLGAAGSKTMIGWNISRQFAVITPEENEALMAAGPLGRFTVEINADLERYGRDVSGLLGYDLADPVAMAVALDASIVTDHTDESMVVGLDEPSRGAVLLDRRAERVRPNCRVIWAIDEQAFKRRLLAACSSPRSTN